MVAFIIVRTPCTVMYGGQSTVIESCFSANGIGTIHTIQGNMNGAMFQHITENNLVSSAKKLNLGRRWTFQQDNDCKHTARITQQVSLWNSLSLNLNPNKNV